MQQFYERYKNGYSDSPEHAIDFYNENLILFRNTTQFKNENEFIIFISVYYELVTAFVKKKQYKNAIKALGILPVIEKAIDDFKIGRSTLNNYRWLLFQQAIALYNLRHFHASKKIFKVLLSYDIENDNLKLWIENSNLGLIQKTLPAILSIAVLSFIGEIISKSTNYITIHHVCNIVAAMAFLTSLIIVTYTQWKSTKKKIIN